LPDIGVTFIRETWSPPARTLLPGHRSYGLMRQSRSALLSFGLSLVRGVFAGCCQPLLPTGPSRRYLCESFPGCLGPCHGGTAECLCLFLPPRHRPSPVHYRGRLPASPRRNDFLTDPFSRLQPFLYVQAPKFARLPDRSYRCGLSLQGSRGFYIRAEHASSPPHASDMLTIRFRQLMVWGLTPHKIHSLVGCSSDMGMFHQSSAADQAYRDSNFGARGG
jgi:hypothetical protein